MLKVTRKTLSLFFPVSIDPLENVLTRRPSHFYRTIAIVGKGIRLDAGNGMAESIN